MLSIFGGLFAPRPKPAIAWGPGPEFLGLVDQYREMHLRGAFPGFEIRHYREEIRMWIQELGARTVIDFGSGKGLPYKAHHAQCPKLDDYWGVRVTCYDPGVPEFSRFPTRRADLVVSSDVMEHIDERDVPMVIDQMFSLAERGVFAGIAAYPALTHLPDGRNAHVTVRPPSWWHEHFRAAGTRHGKRWRICVVTNEGEGRFTRHWIHGGRP